MEQIGNNRGNAIYERWLIKTGEVNLPPECYDPVTMEVLTDPYLTRCGHTFNGETLKKIHRVEGEFRLNCPICRKDFDIRACYYSQNSKELVEIIKDKYLINLERRNSI